MNKIYNKEYFHDYVLAEDLVNIYKDYVDSTEQDFDKFIKKYIDTRTYLFLSNVGENILNWYSFDENKNVLEISSDFGQITNSLSKKNLNITKYELDELKLKFSNKRFKDKSNVQIKSIASLDDDKQEYDYIILSNILDFENLEVIVNSLSKKLSEQGKLIIIFENSNSVSSLSTVDNVYSNLYFTEDKDKLSISRVENILEKNNLNNKNIYYPFPNSYIPSIIYEDEFVRKYITNISYTPYVKEYNIIVADEEEMLNQILKENNKLLRYFSNAYIVEASKAKINTNANMVSFNNYRKDKYSLITVIKDNKVYKLPRCIEANEHLSKMQKGIKELKSKLNLLDDIDEENNIYSKYIENLITLDKKIYKEYKATKDLVSVANIYNDSYKEIRKHTKSYHEVEKNELLDGIPQEILEKMNFLEVCPWDMVAKNCFYINDEYVYFDQEWYEKSLPLEFLIYRSVINSYQLVKKINVNELFKILKIDEYIQYFETINNRLFTNILNDKINKLYTNDNTKLDNLLYSQKEVEIYKRMIEEYKENNRKQDEYIKHLEKAVNKNNNKSLKQTLKNLVKLRKK